MLLSLRSLLDNFGRHTNGTGGNLAHTGGCNVCRRLQPCWPRRAQDCCAIRRSLHSRAYSSALDTKDILIEYCAFHAIVGNEEECGAGRRADKGGPDTAKDVTETAGSDKSRGGLQSCFQRVKGKEGEVDCCACEATGLLRCELDLVIAGNDVGYKVKESSAEDEVESPMTLGAGSDACGGRGIGR